MRPWTGIITPIRPRPNLTADITKGRGHDHALWMLRLIRHSSSPIPLTYFRFTLSSAAWFKPCIGRAVKR